MRLRALSLAVGMTMAAPVHAAETQPYDAATRAALQAVIAQQIDAFNRGDAKAAESFAAPALRSKYPDADRFFAMVKTSYAALIHPRSTSFGETADSPHGPLQNVVVVAADGTVWKAIYAFQKVEGGWRIIGCGLSRDDSQRAI